MRALSSKIARYRETLLAFMASGVNQVFGSATNLFIGVYLIRHMVPADFGRYNIAFAVTITVAAIGNAMFLIPMTVGIPHDDPNARNRFMLEYIATSALCLASAGAVMALAAIGLIYVKWLSWGDAAFAIPTICSCLSFFLKDAMVQAGYNQGRESTTILINIASVASIALLILISLLRMPTVTAPWAIVGYTISQLVALGVGYALVFGAMPLPTFATLRATTHKLLGQAFWPACASALSLLRAQAHTVVVAGLIGPAGVAAINASRLIFAPVQMAQPALVRAAMPRLVRQLRTNRQAFQRGTIAITGALGLFSLFYCLTAIAAGPWIFPIVVGHGYQYSAIMLLAWGCFLTCVALRSGIELNQQALQRFKSLAGINVPASAASLLGAYALTRSNGPPGAVFGLAIGEIVIIAFLFFRIRAAD